MPKGFLIIGNIRDLYVLADLIKIFICNEIYSSYKHINDQSYLLLEIDTSLHHFLNRRNSKSTVFQEKHFKFILF